jgi:hypothetical protein
MFLLYHFEGCNICKLVLHECYINDLYTTTCSGMLGHHKLSISNPRYNSVNNRWVLYIQSTLQLECFPCSSPSRKNADLPRTPQTQASTTSWNLGLDQLQFGQLHHLVDPLHAHWPRRHRLDLKLYHQRLFPDWRSRLGHCTADEDPPTPATTFSPSGRMIQPMRPLQAHGQTTQG